MDSCDDTPKGWVAPFGHPRINACSRLSVAFRSVPRPSSPPGAKASTECPSLARDSSPDLIRGSPPCTETILSGHQPPRNELRKQITLAQHTTVVSEHHAIAQTPYSVWSDFVDSQWLRPETHQNLIHPDKDRCPQLETPPASRSRRKPQMPIAVASPRYIPTLHITEVVEVIGLEPTTPCLQSRCSPS